MGYVQMEGADVRVEQIELCECCEQIIDYD